MGQREKNLMRKRLDSGFGGKSVEPVASEQGTKHFIAGEKMKEHTTNSCTPAGKTGSRALLHREIMQNKLVVLFKSVYNRYIMGSGEK
jgi:hypothetical protein